MQLGVLNPKELENDLQKKSIMTLVNNQREEVAKILLDLSLRDPEEEDNEEKFLKEDNPFYQPKFKIN